MIIIINTLICYVTYLDNRERERVKMSAGSRDLVRRLSYYDTTAPLARKVTEKTKKRRI